METPFSPETLAKIALLDQLEAVDLELRNNAGKRMELSSYRRRILEKLKTAGDEAQSRLL